MKTVFLSYSRKNQVQAHALAEDAKALGHQVWMDHELSGGQVWWAQILERVRACDVFLCTLAPEPLESEACRRELAYAVALGKPILPVMIADGVSPHLLPPQLASLQIVDHRASDRESVLQLARALGNLPAPPPLPEPLPAPPPAPLSYLGTLTERIDSEQPLDFQGQSGVLVDLKRALRNPESAVDALTLLARFRRRRDLLAWIAEELDELVRSAPKAQPPPESEPREALPPSAPESRREVPFAPWIPPAPRAHPTGPAPPAKRDPLGRGKAVIVGFCVGSAIGVLTILITTKEPDTWWMGICFLGVASAVTGGITGVRRRHITHAVASGIGTGCILALYVAATEPAYVAAIERSRWELLAVGTNLGAPLGLILGATISTLVQRRATKKLAIENRSRGSSPGAV